MCKKAVNEFSALKHFPLQLAACELQMKQSQARPSTYTVTDPRSPEEQSSAAELSSRLARLKAEHQDSAAHAARQAGQASSSQENATAAADSVSEQQQKPLKQKKPRTPKVSIAGTEGMHYGVPFPFVTKSAQAEASACRLRLACSCWLLAYSVCYIADASQPMPEI